MRISVKTHTHTKIKSLQEVKAKQYSEVVTVSLFHTVFSANVGVEYLKVHNKTKSVTWFKYRPKK